LSKRKLKRSDGTLVPFRERQVSSMLHKALDAVGEGDPELANELASAVTLFLSRIHEDTSPEEAELHGMLVRVLDATGHGAAARYLEEAEGERRRVESELMVREHGPEAVPGSGMRPSSPTSTPWQRARMLKHLTISRGLPESLAEDVTTEVELKLARLKVSEVRVGLLRELLEGELASLKIEGTGRGEELPGVSVAEVVEQQATGNHFPGTVASMVSARALAAFAFQSLHGREVVDACQEGLLHVYGTEEPFKLEGLHFPLDHLQGLHDHPYRLLLNLRRTLSVLADHVRGEIFLPDLLEHLSRFDADPADLADALFFALDQRDAYGVSTGPSLRLGVPLTGGGQKPERLLGLCRSVLQVLSGGRSGAPALTLSFRPGAASLPVLPTPTFLESLSRIGSTEVLIERGPPVALNRRPPRRLRAGLGRVAINLPAALLGFDGNGGMQKALESLRPIAGAATTALHENYWNQRSGGREGLHGLLVHLGGPGEVEVAVEDQWGDVEVWGLSHALDLLIARRALTPARRCEGAARILGFIDYILGEDRAGVRFQVRLGATQDRAVRRRFLSALEARARSEGAAERQDLLARGEGDATLPVILPLLSRRNRPLLSASFAERLGRGLALSLSALDEADLVPHLARIAEESRLRLFTLSDRPRGGDLFEIQEELFPDFDPRA
jgi:hypothetical protein